jgi:hypothetical protein
MGIELAAGTNDGDISKAITKTDPRFAAECSY